jgi:hypothetical protein
LPGDEKIKPKGKINTPNGVSTKLDFGGMYSFLQQ